MLSYRYYVAEGVRIYSQETWRLVTAGSGKLYVEKYIQNVVRVSHIFGAVLCLSSVQMLSRRYILCICDADYEQPKGCGVQFFVVCVQTSVTMHVCVLQVEYYVQATDSDNHAVREAACACIAELGSKV